MDKTTIAYKVVIDYDKDRVVSKEQGVKCPIFAAWDTSKGSIAESLRSIAYSALERANFIESQVADGFTPIIDPTDSNNVLMLNQFNKMMSEITLAI